MTVQSLLSFPLSSSMLMDDGEDSQSMGFLQCGASSSETEMQATSS